MDSILLATDGSEDALRATDRAIDLAARESAALHVLCVVDRRRVDEPALSATELRTIYADEHAATSVDEVRGRAAERGVTVGGDIRQGDPAEVILEYADEVDADAIVVGEHGDHDDHFSGVGRAVRERADREVIVVGARA